MKISKLFHWLYGILMLLPILVFIPNAFYYGFNEQAIAQEKTEYERIPVKFNQLIDNGNFEYLGNWVPGSSSYGNVSVSNNEITWTCTSQVQTYTFYSGILQNFNYLNIPYNHKLYIKVDIKPTINQSILIYGMQGGSNTYSFSYNNPNVNEYNKVEFIFPDRPIGSSDITRFRICYGNPLTNLVPNVTLSIKNFNVFDLTEMFGVGNEPSIEQFNTWYPNDYYDYTLGFNTYITNYDNPIITNMSIIDSMSYAWDSVWQNDLFSWSYESFLAEPFKYIGAMFGLPNDNSIYYCLSYWLDISIIWLVFDLIMYVPLLVHRWIDKGILE